MFPFLFDDYSSSNIQDKDETTSDNLNDIDMPPKEEFLPDINSTSLETSNLNPAQGDSSSTEHFINSQEDIVQNRLDEMFDKIIEKLPLNKKIGQLSKVKTRTLAKCKICNKKMSWFKRSHHKKEHTDLTTTMHLLSSNDKTINNKRSRDEESQQPFALSQSKILNSNPEHNDSTNQPDPKRHKGKIMLFFWSRMYNFF